MNVNYKSGREQTAMTYFNHKNTVCIVTFEHELSLGLAK
jgi:hypothetical protein